MNIKHLNIRHFRGIDRLDWEVAGRLVCLIGPGDSTKSTILEAIELALTSRRSVSFDDADFYGADTDNSILIKATVGEVPADLLADVRFLIAGRKVKSGRASLTTIPKRSTARPKFRNG